jgi:MFS family permease
LSARASDILGRKFVLLASLLIFVLFSAGCGLAQTMTQLIIFRAFQGIGGAGIYSLSIALIPEMVPKEKEDLYAAINSATNISMALCGLLVGGIISTKTTWRWIFMIMLVVTSCKIRSPHADMKK